jgi:hypothetical protein
VIKTFSTIQADVTDCSSAIEKFFSAEIIASKLSAMAALTDTRFRKDAGVAVFTGVNPVENLIGWKFTAGSLSSEMPDACFTGLYDSIHCSKAN